MDHYLSRDDDIPDLVATFVWTHLCGHAIKVLFSQGDKQRLATFSHSLHILISNEPTRDIVIQWPASAWVAVKEAV